MRISCSADAVQRMETGRSCPDTCLTGSPEGECDAASKTLDQMFVYDYLRFKSGRCCATRGASHFVDLRSCPRRIEKLIQAERLASEIFAGAGSRRSGRHDLFPTAVLC
jgi:hypothetical protein